MSVDVVLDGIIIASWHIKNDGYTPRKPHDEFFTPSSLVGLSFCHNIIIVSVYIESMHKRRYHSPRKPHDEFFALLPSLVGLSFCHNIIVVSVYNQCAWAFVGCFSSPSSEALRSSLL
jgi:hypothetical protein